MSLEQDSFKNRDEVLKRLRSDEVLDELRKKYGRDKDTNEMESNKEDPSGIKRALAELKQRSERLRASLEGIPGSSLVIPVEEIQSLVEALNAARLVVQHVSERIAQLRNKFGENTEEFKENEEQVLSKGMKDLEKVFDSFSCWSSKFSTDSEGGGGSFNVQLTQHPDTDSLYYVTPHNTSIRFKKANLAKGLDWVVNTPTELIYFVGPNEEVSLRPKVGFRVEEFYGNTFSDYLKSNRISEDFKSEIKIYKDSAGKIHGIIAPQEKHFGDRVNKIYFQEI